MKRYFWGERSIRGFEIYQISPRDSQNIVVGGEKAFYMNLEYRIHLNQNLTLIAFSDLGNAYERGANVDFNNIYSSHGVELNVFIPMLNVPFRLIFAYNPRLINTTDQHFVFRFAVGPSFY